MFLGDDFKQFLFPALFGEDSHFDSYFSNGLKPPTCEVYKWFLSYGSLKVQLSIVTQYEIHHLAISSTSYIYHV